MKLVHQINLAFGLLLVLVVAGTGFVFHYVLLDHFIGVQQKDMRAMNVTLSAKLEKVNASPNVPEATVSTDKPVKEPAAAVESITPTLVPVASATAAPPLTAPAAAASPIALTPLAGVEAVVTDPNGKVIYGSTTALPTALPTAAFTISSQPFELLPAASLSQQEVREGKDAGFLYSVSTVPQGTLTLYTPMSKIEEIERAVLGRLLLVLGAGGVLVFLLSLLITRKLITPLVRLKAELKKVESRRFSEVTLVKAEGEIGAVAQTVFELAGELEKYNRVQKQFFQNASHELKTPLMSISGYAEGIRDGILEHEEARKGLDIILNESGRLKKIVTEMTLLAKLDSEENIFRQEAVSIPELVAETVERINPMLFGKGLVLEAVLPDEGSKPLEVCADRDKLLQAMLNVVANATRYADRRIRIQAGVVHNEIEIKVMDDGTGFPDSLLPYLFHRFVKGKDGETGLGLAISRAIVERCGGTIRAGNGQEGGAVISLRFPTAA